MQMGPEKMGSSELGRNVQSFFFGGGHIVEAHRKNTWHFHTVCYSVT